MVKGCPDGFPGEKANLSNPSLLQKLKGLYISKLTVDHLKSLSGGGIEPPKVCHDSKGGVCPKGGRLTKRLAKGLEALEILCFGCRFGRRPGRRLSCRPYLGK